MSEIRDPLQDLEKHLIQLEEQVDKLIIALDEWRQWKQEYEALRTDVLALSPTATLAALCQTRQAFKGELVNEKELVDIFGRDDSKKRDQIVSTVSNRLEYVTKNITTLSKQLEVAENKLAAGRVVSNPDATDEEGLPITEINEELDEDDNVVSYSLRRPGDNQAQLLDALDKAGVKDLSSEARESETAATPSTAKPTPVTTSKPVEPKHEPKPNEENTKDVQPPARKKSVAFTEDTKSGHDEKPVGAVQRLEELYRQAKEQESILEDPVRPADESPEDADLREDMIRYNKETMMYEMAPIVAELQVEEGSDDGWNDDDSEEFEDDDDDEDQWGRSTSGVVDDDYRREMLELKERLSKHTFGEKKAAENDEEDDEFSEGIGRITVRQEGAAPTQNDSVAKEADVATSSTSKGDVQKRTRFAPSLDIIEPEQPPAPTSSTSASAPQQQPEVDPLSDVVERTPSGAKESTPAVGRKVSKFRRDKAAGELPASTLAIAPEKPTETARYAPSGPEGRTLATDILENEPSGKIKEPDELDANLLHQQVTEEYYKMRNKMIGRQGGFVRENTDAIQPLDEEEGGPKRLSRFKAARLARS